MVCEADPARVRTMPASFAYRVSARGVETLTLAQAEAAYADKGLLWVHVDGNDAACLAWLDTQSHLAAPVAEALQAMETRPRATPMSGGAIVNLRGLATHRDEDADELVSLRLWAEHGRVITLAYTKSLGQ